MSTFNCRGIELGGLRQGAGPSLLALHGGGGPGSLSRLCEGLAADFEVIAPTHPGFDGSPTDQRVESVDDLAYLYLDLMDELGLDDVTLMGFSLGGWVAAEMAVRSTSRIARLVLVDAVGIRVPGREDCEIADIFSAHPASLAGRLFHDPSRAPDPSRMSEADAVAGARAREAMVRYAWEPYMHNPKLRDRLHRIDVPALLVWGDSDGVVSVAYGEAYCAAIPGARLVVIGEAGHQPQIEQPDRFVDAFLSFAR